MNLRCWLINLLLIFVCYHVYAQTNLDGKQKEAYDYLLYLPKTYAGTTRNYPLVIYLHGGSLRGNDLNKLKTYGVPYYIEKGCNYPFIVASPQCPGGKYWSTDNWFEPLFTDLKAKYRIDTNRVYVTGVSMGGFGAWQVAMDNPRTFAALVPLCGGCNDSTEICRIRHVPVWTFHGTADDVIPISETERLTNKLDQCDGNVRYSRLKNKGHDILYLYGRRAIYRWMLKQHR